MTERPLFQDNETIRLTKDGEFLSNGEPITHDRTIEAYHRHLRRDAEGWFIEIGNNLKRIEVEDTGYFVRDIEWSGEAGSRGERVELLLSDGARETLDPGTLSYRPDRLVCMVKGGHETARFLRKPYHELLLRALHSGTRYELRIGGRAYALTS
jgi:hypothetical protein